MKKLNSAVTIMSKVIEIMFWLGSIIFLIIGIASIALKDDLSKFVAEAAPDPTISFSGFDILIFDQQANLIPEALTLLCVVSIPAAILMAMIFRNIYLIFRTTQGKTKFSRGTTPFQKDNIRMVREIGIFAIAIPVTEFVISIVGQLIIGNTALETSLQLDNIVMGLVILCLSQFFAYGTQLQNDVDGLI